MIADVSAHSCNAKGEAHPRGIRAFATSGFSLLRSMTPYA